MVEQVELTIGNAIVVGHRIADGFKMVKVLLLAVSIVVESELWAMVTMGATNIAYSFWFLLLKIPGLPQQLKSPVVASPRPG
jgi:hypothetical protein